jgi:hypothetical protein
MARVQRKGELPGFGVDGAACLEQRWVDHGVGGLEEEKACSRVWVCILKGQLVGDEAELVDQLVDFGRR